MNRTVVLTLGGLLVTPALAVEVNESLDAAGDGHVEISNIAGEVEVVGWNRSSVEVTGELGKNVEELIFERNGDRVIIKVKVPRSSSRNIGSDLYVRVPEESSVEVGTVSADIDVEGVSGDIRLHTVSGDVNAEDVMQDANCESVSGDIEIVGGGKDADTRAGSVSGDVTVFRVAGSVSLQTVSGDLVIDEGSFDRVRLEAVNGDIDLDFVGDVDAEIEVDTFNGSIDNCFGPEPRRTSKYAPGWELSFTEGKGSGRVTMSTMNGDMRICKQ